MAHVSRASTATAVRPGHSMDNARLSLMGRRAVETSAASVLIALCAGAAALIAPVLSLLLLVALAARASMRADAMARFKPLSIAGPAFAALTVGAFVGLAGAIGVLFAWRLIADARWSAHEADRLATAAGKPNPRGWIGLAHVWLTPIYALSLVAYTAPHMVAGLPLDLPHLPGWAPLVLGLAAAAALLDWALRRAVDWRLGELAEAPSAHLLAHHAIFLAAFGFGSDLSAGLVALMAWRLAHAAPLRVQASLTAVP